ncbi:MAG: DUF4928 family protein [Planctomycetes bacterium]|nr:DUF4928 family protein [Planctomycetota bacterium]
MGTLCAALVVLQRLRTDFDLDIERHVAEQGAQIATLSAESVARVLAEYGETRQLTKVGGRTNRGARGDIADLLQTIKGLDLATESRELALTAMQRHIVDNYVALHFKKKRVKARFNADHDAGNLISEILANAQTSGKAGAVAEYLIGAKLALIYPEIEIRNKPYSSGDDQVGHEGDFQVNRTVFHVTVAPMAGVYSKIQANLDRGLKALLLVPRSKLEGASQNVAMLSKPGVGVDSIEAYLGRNIDELAKS